MDRYKRIPDRTIRYSDLEAMRAFVTARQRATKMTMEQLQIRERSWDNIYGVDIGYGYNPYNDEIRERANDETYYIWADRGSFRKHEF